MLMEYIFPIDEGERATFLQNLVHSSGCTYICLWQSYLPQASNGWLVSLDGFYNEENISLPSSSSGSHARRLFDEYRQSVLAFDNEYDPNPSHVPGFAFRNGVPFMELKELDLQRLASVEPQLRFYQEARIKTAVFLGCMAGEIELGFSVDTTQVNLEMEMRKWIPKCFPDKQITPIQDLRPPTDRGLTRAISSSSSSLQSPSTDNSLEHSPFFFNIPNTPYNPRVPAPRQPPIEQEPLMRPTTSSSTLLDPLHQAIQSFNQTRVNTNYPFLTPETEDEAITKAILAVLSSPSPSASASTTSTSPQSAEAQNFPHFSRNATGAFNRYQRGLVHNPPSSTPLMGKRTSMFKRAISFFRSLSLMVNQERGQVRGSRPTENQLYHMISERKRREKLNESFQALRSLLPPGAKKDKASVLSGTSEYLSSLKSQVAELTRRNHILEAQLLPGSKPGDQEMGESSYDQRVDVKVVNVGESSPEARIVDLFVVVRGDDDILDLMIRLLEFLKMDKRVSFISLQADTKVEESNRSVKRAVLRLQIEGIEWDESTFQEAVAKVVADLAK